MLVFVVSAWVLMMPAHAQEVLLPSIGPTLTTAQPDACGAPCERTAALTRNILAVSRMTPLAPAGEVAIYMRRDGAWSETALIASPAPCVVPPSSPGQDPLPCQQPLFGSDLALSRRDLFASVDPNLTQPGAVYVLRLVGDQWQQLQKLEFPTPGAIPQSLRISAIEAAGHTVAVGISFTALANGESRSSAAVHVFERARNGHYRRSAILSPEDAQSTDFGAALAIRGHTLVVGAASATEMTGAAYVFNRKKHGWQLQQKLSPSFSGAQSFGRAVAVGHGTIAIGAPDYFDTADVSAGLVYVYQHSGGSWLETEVLHDPIVLAEPGATNRRFFGTTLALQSKRLMVGVSAGRPLEEEDPLTLLFERMPEGWHPVAGFSPHDVPVLMQLSRDTALIVGAQLRFGNQTYVYDDLPRFSP
jgi:hypothetical protein